MSTAFDDLGDISWGSRGIYGTAWHAETESAVQINLTLKEDATIKETHIS